MKIKKTRKRARENIYGKYYCSADSRDAGTLIGKKQERERERIYMVSIIAPLIPEMPAL